VAKGPIVFSVLARPAPNPDLIKGATALSVLDTNQGQTTTGGAQRTFAHANLIATERAEKNDCKKTYNMQ